MWDGRESNPGTETTGINYNRSTALAINPSQGKKSFIIILAGVPGSAQGVDMRLCGSVILLPALELVSFLAVLTVFTVSFQIRQDRRPDSNSSL
jgi:hypothetical protein